ncbi:hypothetical protein [Streptomyces qinglanensis]|uniref:hypothetical protein n=1 Tax=Streptomyces qinglanensis TaxID=943816 RepID=UPI003D71F730
MPEAGDADGQGAGHCARWRARSAAALLAAAAGLGPATVAVAADGSAAPAAYPAEQLRENPVHLSDQLPRTNPLSARPAFAEAAKRTGVPTYVLVLPGSGGARDVGLLAAVHDRLGKDGLYVLLGEDGGSPRTETFGVDVPARDAAMATTFELPYDAGTLETFRHFVEVLRSGAARGGDPGKMVDVVRYRMAEGAKKKAVCMTLSTDEGFLNGYEFPRDGQYQAFWGVAAVGHQDDMKDRSLYAEFSRALEIVRSGAGEKQYEKATADLHDDDPADRDGGADGGGGDGDAAGAPPRCCSGC